MADRNFREANLRKFGRITLYLWRLLYHVSFYSQGDYDPSNKYSAFIRKLFQKSESFGSISFNYDTLLDKALDREYESVLYGSLDNYIESRLIKPHGSVNWFIPNSFNVNGSRDVHIDAASKAIFTGPINSNNVRVYSPFHTIDINYFLHNNDVPLILMPLTTKLYSFFDQFYRKMLTAGTQLLAQAKEIYVIGYQAQDEIIRDLFKEVQKGTIIHVVGNRPQTAARVMDRVLGLAEGLVQGETIDGGFAKFCDNY